MNINLFTFSESKTALWAVTTPPAVLKIHSLATDVAGVAILHQYGELLNSHVLIIYSIRLAGTSWELESIPLQQQ